MPMTTDERLLYTTNLLSETLPEEFMTKKHLLALNIHPDQHFIILQLMLNNTLKTHINSLNPDAANTWKSQLHHVMQKHFAPYVICFLNLQPFTRTVVLSVDTKQPLAQVQLTLGQRFLALSNELETMNAYNITGCFGSIVSNYFQIGTSYKQARHLQEYHFVIGLGNFAFSDNHTHGDEYSLVEYQYVHRFETLFREKNWSHLLELFHTIKHSLIQHHVNDSKVTYIYKEIFSITIRQLFDRFNDYKHAIETLNTGIIMFDHLFDDIEQVHHYYLTIFEQIAGQTHTKCIHPHIKKALDYIHANYNKELSLNNIADILHISTAYFSRLFKQEMDINYKDYLTHYRIKKSKEYLAQNRMTIKAISACVGYTSPTQFARVFRQTEGMSPSKYRQLQHHTT